MSDGTDFPLECIFAAAVAVGYTLDAPLRPFYVAYLSPIGNLLGHDAWSRIGMGLDAWPLSESAELFRQWAEHADQDNHRECARLERDLELAGFSARMAKLVIAANAELNARLVGIAGTRTDGMLH